MGQQSVWVVIALAVLAPSGIGAAVVIWLLSRRVEGAKAKSSVNTSVFDGWDRLNQRNEKALERQDRDIDRLEQDLAERDERIAELEAELNALKRGKT